jgi:hypothetical protein
MVELEFMVSGLIGDLEDLAKSLGAKPFEVKPHDGQGFADLPERLVVQPKSENRSFFKSLTQEERDVLSGMLRRTLETLRSLPDTTVAIEYGMYGYLPALLLGRFRCDRLR